MYEDCNNSGQGSDTTLDTDGSDDKHNHTQMPNTSVANATPMATPSVTLWRASAARFNKTVGVSTCGDDFWSTLLVPLHKTTHQNTNVQQTLQPPPQTSGFLRWHSCRCMPMTYGAISANHKRFNFIDTYYARVHPYPVAKTEAQAPVEKTPGYRWAQERLFPTRWKIVIP